MYIIASVFESLLEHLTINDFAFGSLRISLHKQNLANYFWISLKSNCNIKKLKQKSVAVDHCNRLEWFVLE